MVVHRWTAASSGRVRLQPRDPFVHGFPLFRRQRPGVPLELLHPSLHHQIGSRGHRDLLQQPLDHLRRDRIGRVGEQHDRRPGTGESPLLEAGADALRDHDGDRHIAIPDQPLRAGAIECRRVRRGRADPQRALLAQRLDDPPRELRLVLVDDLQSTREASDRRHVRRTRWRKSRRRQSGARTSAFAPPGRASGSSSRCRAASASLAQLPSGQMNEYGLQARPTHLDVIHGSAGGAIPSSSGGRSAATSVILARTWRASAGSISTRSLGIWSVASGAFR